MGDDAANEWGTVLTLLDTMPSRRISLGGSTLSQTELTSAVKVNCAPFAFVRTVANGSQANAIAISMVTGFRNHLCLFAAGSYVAGDSSVVQTLSTSSFVISEKLAEIQTPHLATDLAREQTIALPYHIPCSTCRHEGILESYEDECLKELHLRCVLQRIKGDPFRALFMELMLAGNGATLSDRFTRRLARLSVQHGFWLAIDEVMTGGRSGTMLFTQQQPEEFRKRVFVVTLGKWTHAGMILTNEEINVEGTFLDKIFDDRIRGVSTPSSVNAVCRAFVSAVPLLRNAETRRKDLLRKLKVDVECSWGISGTVFCSTGRTDSKQGLKCRFLPMLNDVVYDKFPTKKGPLMMKDNCCMAIRTQVQQWVRHSETVGLPIQRSLCCLLSSRPDLGHPGKKELLFKLNAHSTNKYSLVAQRTILQQLINAKMAEMKRKSKKRAIGFVYNSDLFGFKD